MSRVFFFVGLWAFACVVMSLSAGYQYRCESDETIFYPHHLSSPVLVYDCWLGNSSTHVFDAGLFLKTSGPQTELSLKQIIWKLTGDIDWSECKVLSLHGYHDSADFKAYGPQLLEYLIQESPIRYLRLDGLCFDADALGACVMCAAAAPKEFKGIETISIPIGCNLLAPCSASMRSRFGSTASSASSCSYDASVEGEEGMSSPAARRKSSSSSDISLERGIVKEPRSISLASHDSSIFCERGGCVFLTFQMGERAPDEEPGSSVLHKQIKGLELSFFFPDRPKMSARLAKISAEQLLVFLLGHCAGPVQEHLRFVAEYLAFRDPGAPPKILELFQSRIQVRGYFLGDAEPFLSVPMSSLHEALSARLLGFMGKVISPELQGCEALWDCAPMA